MNGPSFNIQSDDEDEVVVINQDELKRSTPMFQLPQRDMLINPVKVSKEVFSSSDYSTTDTETETDSDSPVSMPRSNAPTHDPMSNRFANERSRLEVEAQAKRELLHKIDRLEARGTYKMSRKFNMQDDYEEMQVEYERVKRERDLDISIRFQSRMLITAVTGIEVLNNTYDPFRIHLRGWSDQVSSEINDYDDIFADLHDKYQASDRKMAPEIRLMFSLAGSGFLYHLGNKVIKSSATPEVEDILNSDPALMKQFREAAARRMASQNSGGFLGNILSAFTGQGKPMQQQQQQQPQQRPQPQRAYIPQAPISSRGNDIEDIIKEVSSNSGTRFETMSADNDDDIISIVEDAISNTSGSRGGGRGSGSVRGGGRGRGGRSSAVNTRVLNL